MSAGVVAGHPDFEVRHRPPEAATPGIEAASASATAAMAPATIAPSTAWPALVNRKLGMVGGEAAPGVTVHRFGERPGSIA